MTDSANIVSNIEMASGFGGSANVIMDSAKRIAVPLKFKEMLEKIYGPEMATCLVLAPDNHKLKAYPIPVWQAREEELKKLNKKNIAAEKLKTFILGNREYCAIDGQNRMRIPSNLCDLVMLKKEIVLSGKGDNLEIWDAAKWNEFNLSTMMSFDDLWVAAHAEGGQ